MNEKQIALNTHFHLLRRYFKALTIQQELGIGSINEISTSKTRMKVTFTELSKEHNDTEAEWNTSINSFMDTSVEDIKGFNKHLSTYIRNAEALIEETFDYPHYQKYVGHHYMIDFYKVSELFGFNEPSGRIHHANKKTFNLGKRGDKDKLKDLSEAIYTLQQHHAELLKEVVNDA